MNSGQFKHSPARLLPPELHGAWVAMVTQIDAGEFGWFEDVVGEQAYKALLAYRIHKGITAAERGGKLPERSGKVVIPTCIRVFKYLLGEDSMMIG